VHENRAAFSWRLELVATIGTAEEVDHWSVTSSQQRLVKTGGRLVKQSATTDSCWPRAVTRRVFGADLGTGAAGGIAERVVGECPRSRKGGSGV
jgi:hypothetical protein